MNSIGVIGMGVMGKNLAVNIANKGFPVAVYNRSFNKAQEAAKLVDNMQAQETLEGFVKSIERPRKIILMLKAGTAVDEMGTLLREYLEDGDIVLDGGNEWYENTERRQAEFLDHGIHWLGMGVSGGEKGALHGPSLMVGGDKEAYDKVSDILGMVAAPDCVDQMGLGGSGHYVKMVHNGIEYGMMQAIAEIYWILKMYGGLKNDEIANVFEEWNRDVFDCFLLEITCKILRKKEGGKFLLDQMVHSVGMNGTGTWTAQEGLRVGVPVSTIAAAVDSRLIGADKFTRSYMDHTYQKRVGYLSMMIDHSDLRNALWVTFMVCYAQGLHLIGKKSEKKTWNVNMYNAVRVWRDGCIIRSGIVNDLSTVHSKNINYRSLLTDPSVRDRVQPLIPALRRVVGTSQLCGVAVPALSATLNYLEQNMMTKGPWSLMQAQRDCFGAHGFERMDKNGVHHANWWEV